ncbi:fibronectin type III-like domain-contianing protein [Haloferax sp. Atlit-4N]|uniref:fibronectin type III-like domain-contianing protein n=1 Tax=Haloferax sp. Atlit-4N TaxID=2077206 RepID=UPI001314E094|nr:fibronectin type III-like domain-contianing protein [Haloferax sp. Atlit-4N]
MTNATDSPETEVVQFYTSPELPNVARPVQGLKGFQRNDIDGDESERITFDPSRPQLAYHDRDAI